MLVAEFLAFWGKDNLKRWSARSLEDVAIPMPSKQFLRDVGLPCNEDWTFRFDVQADELPSLPNKKHYRRIGYDDLVPICLNEKRGGAVIAVETELGGSDRFMNSSVERFGESLLRYQEYRRIARSASEEDVLSMIPSIEEKLRRIDPDAFDDPNNYWPAVLEQMNQGLL